MLKLRHALLHQLRLLAVALQFLTRLPVPALQGWRPEWLSLCLVYFPLVGALVGLLCGLVLVAAAAWWPPTVAVGVSMVFSVWLTGAFHEDGWADTCDALGGAVSRERALLIMKDSRIGTYGAVGLILMLGLKAAVLVALVSPLITELNEAQTSHVHQVLLGWAWLGLIWCHAASRLVPVLISAVLPYAGDADHAKAKPLATQVGRRQALGAALTTVAVVASLWLWMWLNGWPTGTLWRAMGYAAIGMALGGALVGRWLRQRLGGFTGDGLGASQQVAELAGLLGWLMVIRPA
jgi:adenosylcobinamide-GDP ribazoletransferase